MYQAHPGTNITVIDSYNRFSSIDHPMREQAIDISQIFQSVMHDHPEGVHVIGYSQGP